MSTAVVVPVRGGAAAPAEVGPNLPAVLAPPTHALSSVTLLQGRPAVHIEHNGTLYLLRATRLGKLILTK